MKSSTTEEEKSEERVDTRHLEANNVSTISILLPHLRYAKSRGPENPPWQISRNRQIRIIRPTSKIAVLNHDITNHPSNN